MAYYLPGVGVTCYGANRNVTLLYFREGRTKRILMICLLCLESSQTGTCQTIRGYAAKGGVALVDSIRYTPYALASSHQRSSKLSIFDEIRFYKL